MKTIEWKNGIKKKISAALVITMMLSILSCSQIDLSVMRLAEPARLTPPKVGYTVWMETEKNGTKNLGQLKTSSGMMSKTLKSSLETVTAFKPTGFFITGEDDVTTQYPGLVVLRTGAFSIK